MIARLMLAASEVESISSSVSIWRLYDPAVKAELYSTAVGTGDRTYLIDPVPLASEPLADIAAQCVISGIVVTNANHGRATAVFAERFRVPVYVHSLVADKAALPRIQVIEKAGKFARGLTAITI